ncbi:hypothetical protein AOLI_G00071600 [Acnodon oligacanthus]
MLGSHITDVTKFKSFDETFEMETHYVELADGTKCKGDIFAVKAATARGATVIFKEGKDKDDAVFPINVQNKLYYLSAVKDEASMVPRPDASTPPQNDPTQNDSVSGNHLEVSNNAEAHSSNAAGSSGGHSSSSQETQSNSRKKKRKSNIPSCFFNLLNS